MASDFFKTRGFLISLALVSGIQIAASCSNNVGASNPADVGSDPVLA